EMLILAQMQWLGECPMPWVINSEIGTLKDDGPPGGKLFRFLRYDVRLEADWLAENPGLNGAHPDVHPYRCADDPPIVDDMYAIAKVGAEKQVQLEHLIPARPA